MCRGLRIRFPAVAGLINSTAMGNRGRLIAPGGLQDELAAGPGDDTTVARDGEPLAALAARHGLRPSSARPTLAFYLRKVWERRHFIVAYATARNVSMYTEARLGQLWQVLTPLLNSAVYYLIFGVLFKANRGITNYTAYLVTGVFIFAFTERSIVVGSTVMRVNITLIRTLHFPRACLPLAYVLVEFQQLLQATFNMGAALPAELPVWAKNVLSFNPAAVYISLTRYAVMSSYRADAPGAKPYNAARCAIFTVTKTPSMQAYCHPDITTSELWLAGVGWAVVMLVAGVLYFWQAETRYGRG